MTINRLITILALLCIAIGASANKKQDYPQSEIKVGYDYHYKFMRNGDGVIVYPEIRCFQIFVMYLMYLIAEIK